MSSGEWMTLHKAVLRLTLKGMEESAALHGLNMAMHNREIATREIQPRPSRAYEATEMTELLIADFVSWEDGLLEVGRDRGGRPPDPRWPDFYTEIIRIMSQRGGLPKKQIDLINEMRDWAERNWGKTLSDGTLKQRISAIYANSKKGNNQLSTLLD